MPISMEEFEKGEQPSGERRSLVTPKVIEFLKSNKQTGYTTKEVADATQSITATVNQVLRKLASKNQLERRSVDGRIYHRWTGD